MKKQLLTMVALGAMTLSATALDKWDLGGVVYEADTLYHVTSGPGVTTTGIRLINPNNVSNIHYSVIDLTNPGLELRGVFAKDGGNVTENVQAMAKRKDAQGDGQYIAGTNGDFFNMGAAPNYPLGNHVVNGTLMHQSFSGSDWTDWATYVAVEGAKDVRILQNVKASRMANFPSGESHWFAVNGDRWSNYLVIYTPGRKDADGNAITSTGTNVWGRECTARILSGSIATNDAVFEITSEVVGNLSGDPSHGNMTIPEDGVVLSGTGDAYEMLGKVKVGDKVTLGSKVSCGGVEIDPSQLVGGMSYIVCNGDIAPADYLSASRVDHFTSNQARTVIGYNADRTKLIMLVCDKYTSGQHTTADAFKQTYGESSTGMIMKRMGYIMKYLGCYTAMAFDGGGSSQLYNKGLGTINAPYGADYLRPVVNGFFAVSTTPVDNEIAQLEVRQKSVKLAAGETFTPVVYGYNKYGVVVDNNVKGYTLTVAPELGTVSGTTLTASDAAASTHAVVSLGAVKCGVRILTNGGGKYVTSGDDAAPLMVNTSYTPDEAMGYDREPLYLSEQWSFVNANLNDGWDGTVPDWASADAIKSKPCPRFATAYNGVLYTVDMTTMSIAAVDKEGNMTSKYKLPSLEGRVINSVPDYYGCAISVDDFGNFLVGHLFTKTDAYRVWTVYSPATGKAKHFEAVLPEGEKSNGRIDQIGRVVGDLTKDAYAYVAPKATGSEATQKALLLHFTGDGDVDNVEMEPQMSDKCVWLAGSGNTMSIIQPKYLTAEETAEHDINDTYYWYSKAAGVGNYSVDLFTNIDGENSDNYALNWNNYSRLNGFDTFEMHGKRYVVLHYCDNAADNSNQAITVFDLYGNRMASWSNPGYTSTAGYNSIICRPVNENQVDIYVYNCTGKRTGEDTSGAIAGALLSLTYETKDFTVTDPQDPTSGIEDVVTGADDLNAPAVYYNLQGVQVKNPQGGIYIVRRGNTVSKELVK